MEAKYFKVCRVRCKLCGDVLEHINRTKQDNHNDALWCLCRKTMLDPSASFYRIMGNPEEYEDLSEEWEEEKIIDPTGAELHPGDPAACQGNGEHPGFECCCDECDYFRDCFPNWKEMLHEE